MYHLTKWDVGHSLYADHIERGERKIRVRWFAPAKRVNLHDNHGLQYEAGWRWAIICCETEEGAIKIARWHNLNGRGFAVIKEPTHLEALEIIRKALAEGRLTRDQFIEKQLAKVRYVAPEKLAAALPQSEIEIAMELVEIEIARNAPEPEEEDI